MEGPMSRILRPLVGWGVMSMGMVAVLVPSDGYAHWCSNIYQTYARIVVKPERQTISVPDGQTGELKVRVPSCVR